MKRSKSWLVIGAFTLTLGGTALVACGSSDSGDDDGAAGGTAGSAGTGQAGSGTAGSSPNEGSAGTSNEGGAGTSAGGAGSGGAPQVAANAPKCMSSGKNAFETYKAAAFVAVNKQIFANVTSEVMTNGTTNLGASFTHIGDAAQGAAYADKADVFEGNLAAFLVYAFGGPNSITYTDGKTYQGPQDMASAHAGMNITSDQYDYFITNVVVPALKTATVPDDDISTCFAPVVLGTSDGYGPTLKSAIIGK